MRIVCAYVPNGQSVGSEKYQYKMGWLDAFHRWIGEESAQAIDRAIETRTEETVARLDEATARSAEVSREAVAGLRDQLARVHELTVNLETRAAQARRLGKADDDADSALEQANTQAEAQDKDKGDDQFDG